MMIICSDASQGWGRHMWDLKDGQVLAGLKVCMCTLSQLESLWCKL